MIPVNVGIIKLNSCDIIIKERIIMAKKENIQTITRKFKLYSLSVETNKFWVKRVKEYFLAKLSEYDNKILEYQEWLTNAKTKDKRNSYQKSIDNFGNKKKKLLNEQILFEETIRKYQNGNELTQFESDSLAKIAKDYTYSLIRSACKSEAWRKNLATSYVFSECMNQRVFAIKDDKERKSKIADICNFCLRRRSKIETDNPNSILDIVEIENILNGYGFGYKKTFNSKMQSMMNDFAKGKLKTTLDCYKDDSPFTVPADYLTIMPSFDLIGVKNHKDLQTEIQKDGNMIILNFGGNGTPSIAKFKVAIGSKQKNKDELYSVLFKIFNGENKVAGSSIQIDKNDIILNLSINIPLIVEDKLNPHIVCGVDLGMAIPAVCALNSDEYKREYFGSGDTVKHIRNKYKAQRTRLQRALKLTHGGKGRKKKLKALDDFKARERHWAETYNHKIAKQVVDFAYENGAKYIIMEDLSDYKEDVMQHKFCLGRWCYYQLQQFIEYKARLKGIIVLYVKAAYTSQTCHCCGYIDSGNRPKDERGQSYFKCLNCGTEMNADFNAAKNLTVSTDYTDKNGKTIIDNLPSFMQGKNK